MRVARNTDLRRRELERAAQAGDPQAVLALDQALRRTGEWSRYWAERLYEDFLDDIDTRPRPSERSLAGPVGLSDGRAIRAGPGHEAQIFTPGPFGRVQGLILSLKVENHTTRFGAFPSRHVAEGELTEAAAVRVGLALRSPDQGIDLSPLYWFLNNRRGNDLTLAQRIERHVPSRFLTNTVRLDDLATYELAMEALTHALGDLHQEVSRVLGQVDTTIRRAQRNAGDPLTYEGAVAFVAEHAQPAGMRGVIGMLQAVPGPALAREGDWPQRLGYAPIRPWNASGGALLEAAVVSLARFLERNERAVIQGLRGIDAYESLHEAGWFDRAYLNVTSRRARRTRNPLSIEVDWDAVAGAWSNRGEAWIGNQIPPGGLWKIDFANSPSTAAELSRPAIAWIKAAFPNSVILVSGFHESYGRPSYQQEYPRL